MFSLPTLSIILKVAYFYVMVMFISYVGVITIFVFVYPPKFPSMEVFDDVSNFFKTNQWTDAVLCVSTSYFILNYWHF